MLNEGSLDYLSFIICIFLSQKMESKRFCRSLEAQKFVHHYSGVRSEIASLILAQILFHFVSSWDQYRESFYLLAWDYITRTIVMALITLVRAVRLLRAWYMQVKSFTWLFI